MRYCSVFTYILRLDGILKRLLNCNFNEKVMTKSNDTISQVAYKLVTNIKNGEKSEWFSPTKSSDFASF